MQFVTVDDCASRIFAVAAAAANPSMAKPDDKTANRIANRRMTASRVRSRDSIIAP
jgi:hypothetical protein